MSRFKDFDAARAERVGEPLTFKLGGHLFTCKPVLAVGPVLALAARAGDGEGLDAVRAFGAFLRESLIDDDLIPLADVLGEVGFDDLLPVAQWIIEESVGRPLSSASSSPPPGSSDGDVGKNGMPPLDETPTP